MHKYIKMLDDEINRLTDTEKRRGHVSAGTEQYLHFLFENRRHAMEYMERGGRDATAEHAAPPSTRPPPARPDAALLYPRKPPASGLSRSMTSSLVTP